VESLVNSARETALVAALALPAERERRWLVSWAAFAALNSARASLVMWMMVAGHWR
jgi:hypothetical protein